MITYKESGVDIEKSNFFTNIIKNMLQDNNIGRFAGIIEHPLLSDYYLAAAADGIGSKILPLIDYGMYDCIATDLIAMNLNDLVCTGAFPLFFLDYIAVNKLNIEFTAKVINSLKKQLMVYNTYLLGGETSELKDLITVKYFDMAGFAVGLVKKENLLSKENVKEGDIIIGLISNGIHSNGYTLIRRLYETKLLSKDEFINTLKPTYIYVKEILELVSKNYIKACANITGGGISDNLKRIIPEGLCIEIKLNNIPKQIIFEKLEKLIGTEEAYKTFNMGVGFCIASAPENAVSVKNICKRFTPFELGVVKKNDKNCSICFG